MIQVQTKLKIEDNSGVKKVQCIKIFKGVSAEIGDIILVSIKEMRPKLKKSVKIKKGDIFKALIIRTKYPKKNTIGNVIKFDENSAILVDNKEQPIGNRILGPIIMELRKQKRLKIIAISLKIL